MNFWIEFDFPVISEKRVVCRAQLMEKDFKTKELERVYNYLYPTDPYPKVLSKYYKGIARHKNGDENDIELAKNIAKKKALRSLYRGVRTYNYTLLDKIYEYWDRSLNHVYDLADKVTHITNEIKVLAEVENNEDKRLKF